MILTAKELSLLKKYTNIVGVDEAGRGPLAGPIVAAAVSVNKEIADALLALGVNDSKKVTAKKREKITQYVIDQKIPFAVVEVSSRDIDKSGILKANILALENARKGVEGQETLYTIVDGRFSHPFPFSSCEITVRADCTYVAVAAASVVAKVHRDLIMQKEAKRFPKYGFERHKGYGTKAHIEAIITNGPCEIHRLTFEPIKSLLAANR
jgi:ribonuclease HII